MNTKKKKTSPKSVVALEVFLNGKKLTLAGADDLSVLTTNITAVGKLGPKSAGTKNGDKTVRLCLSVGGLTSRKQKSDDFLNWVEGKKLKPKDRIVIKILRMDKTDPPSSIRPKTPEFKKREFKFAKARYLELRKEYEKK